jgi:hypothetical protein
MSDSDGVRLYEISSALVQYAMEIEMVTGYKPNSRPDMLGIVRYLNRLKDEMKREERRVCGG